MPEISLVVTQAVIAHVSKGNESQRQIAIRNPSAEIAPAIHQLSAQNRKALVLGGALKLIIGDSGAIWLAHNANYESDFVSLYDLLARKPGREMRFLCAIE